MFNIKNMLGFLPGLIQFFISLFKICISYLCILCCIKCKDKCINDNDDNNNEPEGFPVISSPTPLIQHNAHPILDAYERSIIAKLHPEAEASENKILNNINNNDFNDNNNKCNI